MPTNPSDIPSDDDIARQEDALMALMQQPSERALQGWPEPPQDPVPVHHATERQAFADLLALLSADDDGDAETEVVALTLDDFDADSIPPPEHDSPISTFGEE